MGAAASGDMRTMIYLCELEGNNAPTQKNMGSALTQAAMEGQLGIVMILCTNLQGDKALTQEDTSQALIQAVAHGQSQVIYYLCQLEGKNAPTQECITRAFEHAVWNEQFPFAQSLCALPKNKRPKQDNIHALLLKAIEEERRGAIEYLCTLAPTPHHLAHALETAAQHQKWAVLNYLCALQSDNAPKQESIDNVIEQVLKNGVNIDVFELHDKSPITRSLQKIAFKKIYNALYDSQSGFKSKHFFKNNEHNLSIAEIKAHAQNQGSRTAKAWTLAKRHFLNCDPIKNPELVKTIYQHSFEKSHIFARSQIITGTTFWRAKKVKKILEDDNFIINTERLKPHSRTAKICSALSK